MFTVMQFYNWRGRRDCCFYFIVYFSLFICCLLFSVFYDRIFLQFVAGLVKSTVMLLSIIIFDSTDSLHINNAFICS